MMALAGDNVEVIGVSTVSGNVSLDQVSMNVLRLLSFLGYGHIPVYAGAHRPLVEPARDASGVHGSNGLGDVALPPAGRKLETVSAPEGLYRAVREHPGTAVVALGPLTNIACTIVLHPDFHECIDRLYIMGGAVDRGNVTRYAEFNIAADPEAAEIVFTSGIPVTLLPWDTCLKNIFSEKDLLSLGLEISRAGSLFLEINKAPLKYFEAMTGSRALAMADELAMACCIEPSAVTGTMQSDIRVELSGTVMRGATVTTAGSNVSIVTEIDREKFVTALSRINRLS